MLDLDRRVLLRTGQSIPLNAKAFDLLVVLIENRGRVLAKEELMELIWRDQFVEEANLAVQISTLRRVLGEKKSEHPFIVTVVEIALTRSVLDYLAGHHQVFQVRPVRGTPDCSAGQPRFLSSPITAKTEAKSHHAMA